MDLDKIRNLVEFDTPTVSNGIGLLNFRDPTVGYTGPDVRCLMPDMGVRVGVAVTCRMDTTTAGTETVGSLFNDWLRLIYEASKGEDGKPMPVFAVMEAVGPRPRHVVTIGDGMGTRMRIAGAAAFISNGSVRDIEGLRGVPMPCWAAGLTPMHGRLRWLDVGSPVVIDGMTVRTGDYIHADINGSVLIPKEIADQAYDKAMEVRNNEAAGFARMHSMTIEQYFASLK
ncbi:MAG: hypothetical protein M1370_07655 [Bacteroidetes bacterium]|nr:hypothetical protein [Bacteroidota bacterium]MCL5026255.1 hypothetical protein [Chloroflexota bacterium]